ncbi:hypothetical protein [Paenibacillus medicaginis]|uniref:Uncharacterized protein n=1 Tax=Paenibacillus medicaginis TaxID=1470560 RepID=A0ABV5BXQ5_9BACL
MTTYDEIFTEFLVITKTEPVNVPTEQDKIYDVIHSAVRHYNNRMRTKVMCDDLTETISEELDDDELIIIANFLKLAFLENQLIYFTTLWQPFAQDIGLRNYQAQIKSMEYLIKRQEDKLDQIINRIQTDYL